MVQIGTSAAVVTHGNALLDAVCAAVDGCQCVGKLGACPGQQVPTVAGKGGHLHPLAHATPTAGLEGGGVWLVQGTAAAAARAQFLPLCR